MKILKHRLNKKNVTALLIQIQDECDFRANHLATKAIKTFGLTKEHYKQTGNPREIYNKALSSMKTQRKFK